MVFSHEMLPTDPPSLWITRHAPLIAAGGDVLDLACGSGRNARWLAMQGFQVTALDRDMTALETIRHLPGISTLAADLENAPWPMPERRFDGIVVCRYLHRPLLPLITQSLKPGGILLYETFMQGQEQIGRPRNPDFLLMPDELLHACAGLETIAFEQGCFEEPVPAWTQRICARNPSAR